jgi:hypothetical protein
MTRALGILLALSLYAAAAAAEPPSRLAPNSYSRAVSKVRRFAIVIGNNRSDDPNAEVLRYADDDAIGTARLLAEAGVENELLVTLDADSRRLHPELTSQRSPREADVDAAFAAVFDKIRQAAADGSPTEFLFFYSGHGDVEHGEGYVVLEDTRLTRSLLYGYLARSPAGENHVFVDACKSYFLAFERGPGGRRSAYSQAFVTAAVPASLANTGFVLSTSSDRESHEWERYQAGIMSHEVVSALRGAADTDRDGRVSYAELGAFLTSANAAIENPRFRPDFMVRPPHRDGQKVLLDWGGGGSKLALDAAGFGHVYVEDGQGVRLLDAHPSPDQPLVLHVPAQRPLFLRQNDERAEFVLSTAVAPAGLRLSPVRSEVAARGALHLAFERLFESPFSSPDVRAFERRLAAADASGTLAAPDAPDAAASDRRRVVRVLSGSLALAGVAGGLALNAIAFQRYSASAHESQVDVAASNRSVERLNLASFVAYGVAGAAGALFGATYLWPESVVFHGPSISVTPGSAALNYQRSF